MNRPVIVAALFVSSFACSTSQPRQEQEQKGPIAAPRLRLPTGASPRRVSAELTILTTQETFAGKEELTLAVDRPTELLWLNADGLKILDVQPKAKVVDGGANFLGLSFDTPLPPGESVLRIAWEGKLSSADYDGAFREQENGAWYVITHLEPLGARRIFPCFDEPSFKVPWKVSLRVRKEDGAFFNTPAESQKDEPDGLKLLSFAETRPLPPYLLAFGVGPFQRVDAGKVHSGAPLGIVVTRGKTQWARYSAQSSTSLMNLLEDYFDVPYHYPKLDLIEVPLGTGAMENPGLITFNQRINLARPGEETLQFRRRAAAVEAHEFAHLWFGDMVTTAWWDDIWLNEAFATWMASKVIERFEPRWNEPAARTESLNNAMNADRLLSARRIRQPIQSEGDIKTAFDGITYAKGAAVIGMFEAWVGPERFRAGIRRYLEAHADGNATAAEFFAAISAAAGRDIAPAFSSFVDQPGLPLVTGKLSCEGKPRIELEQTRYLPLGVDGSQVAAQSWQIPLCIRTEAGRSCTLFAEKHATVELHRCPSWVMLNENANGYYRSRLDDVAQQALTRNAGKLSERERMQLLFDLFAAARAGSAEYSRALELAAALSGAKERPVVTASLEVTTHFHDAVPDAARPRYAAFMRKLYGQRAHALGWEQRPEESYDDTLLRPRLLAIVGDQGEDAGLRVEAQKVALDWLADHAAATPEVAETALHLAALDGDTGLWERYYQAAKAERNRIARQRILARLASFRDPALARTSLALIFSDEFDPRETIELVYSEAEWPSTRPIALEFIEKNFDALLPRLPRDSGSFFVNVGARFCDEQHQKEVAGFFGPRARRFTGGERRFSQAIEGMRQCAAFRRRALPALVGFVQKQWSSRSSAASEW